MKNVITMTRYPHWMEALGDEMVRTLQPIAEEWAGLPLNISNIYGIRRYLNGGYMTAHVDRIGRKKRRAKPEKILKNINCQFS